MSTPNFENLLQVLQGKVPQRPTLFEFFLNARLYKNLVNDEEILGRRDKLAHARMLVKAFQNAGYDYATLHGSGFHFPTNEVERDQTRSLNQGFVITDRKSFDAYNWLEPDDFDYSHLGAIADELPPGMKLVVPGPGGVLENVIQLVGYENLCYMVFEDPQLAQDIFDAVGSRLVRYYEICAPVTTVGALISNDDWGFKTQTMLSTEDMRRYVFPWHKQIVEVIHNSGKPAILHSCGNLEKVMDDVIDDMKFDGKHSYEDTIQPVEEAYEQYVGRIAVLGGIDVDFICTSTKDEVTTRSRAMLARAATRGGYALGTGNSVPEYIPDEQYFAMTAAVLETRE